MTLIVFGIVAVAWFIAGLLVGLSFGRTVDVAEEKEPDA